MKQYIFLMIALSSVNISTAETHAALHEQKTISHSVQDEMSPLGFWETQIKYPIFVNPAKNSALETINSEITLIAEKHRCDDDKGDKQFIGSITFLSESVVSIQYADTWLCAGMPHPDGRIGAVTYNMKTGKTITLADELIEGTKEEFSQKIITQLNQTLKTKGSDDTCGQVSNWSYFYLTATETVFTYAADDYSESHCTSEVQINIKDMQQYLNKDSILSRQPQTSRNT
jgi:hypothetical protein